MLSVLLFYLACLLLLSSGCVFAAARFRLRFEEALPLALTGAMLLLFCCGMVGRLSAGVYLLCAAAVLLYVLSLHGGREKRAETMARVFTPGAFLFALMLALLFAADYKRTPWHIDEMTHWADCVKAMYCTDLLYSAPACAANFPAYPPGMALMEYFFLRLYSLLNPDMGYTEWVMYPAYQVFLLSFSFPFLRALEWKKPLRLGLAGAMVLLCPLMMDQSRPYTSLYIDPFLCAVFGGGLAAVFTEARKEWLRYDLYLFSSCAALVLAKPAGLLLAAFLAAAYGAELWLRKGRGLCGRLAGCGLSVFVPLGLWALRRRLDGVGQSFSGKEGAVDLRFALRLALRREGESAYQIIHDDYYARLFTDTVRIKGLSCPYWLLFFLSAAALITVSVRLARRSARLRPAVRVLPWALALITVIYYVSLCYTYIFKFDYWEALTLAQMERYVGIVLYAVYTAALLGFVRLFTEADGGRRVLCAALAAFLLLSPFGRALDVVRRTDMREAPQVYADYRALTARLREETGGSPARICWICQGSKGGEYYGLRYFLRPNTTVPLYQWFLGASPFPEGVCPDRFLRADQWRQELQQYDYLYLEHCDAYFLETCADLFAPDSPPEDKALYRVGDPLIKID